MQSNTLKAEVRESTGKSYARKIRKDGKVPGIFYIHGKDNIALLFEEKELSKLLSSQHSIITLKIDRQSKQCLVREVQNDPITGGVLHIDLMGVSAKEKITAVVPIVLNGTPVGVTTDGGVLHQDLREIEVECLPGDLPQSIECEVSDLAIDSAIYVRDLSVPNVTFLIDDSRPIASVRQLKAALLEEEEVLEGEEAEGAEGEEGEEQEGESE